MGTNQELEKKLADFDKVLASKEIREPVKEFSWFKSLSATLVALITVIFVLFSLALIRGEGVFNLNPVEVITTASFESYYLGGGSIVNNAVNGAVTSILTIFSIPILATIIYKFLDRK